MRYDTHIYINKMDGSARENDGGGMRLLPYKLLPPSLKDITKDYVQKNKSVITNCYKDLSTLVDHEYNKTAIRNMELMWRNVQSALHKSFQDYITKVAVKNELHGVTNTNEILNNLARVKIGDDKYSYAKRLVTVFYVPTKGDQRYEWVKEAEDYIAEKYKIKFTQGGHNISDDKAKRQSCVFDMARALYNDRFGIRVRRAMLRNFKYHLALRSPEDGAEQLSYDGFTYYLYPATSTPSKDTKTRRGPSALQSLLQQQYDRGKSKRELRKEVLSAISRLERNADIGIIEEGDSGTGKGSDLNCSTFGSEEENDDYVSSEFHDDEDSDSIKRSDSCNESSDDENSDDESSDEEVYNSDEEEMFQCQDQGPGVYDLVNALTWCGEKHESPEDVKPNDMNGNVYVCTQYRVWPSHTWYCAVKQQDVAQILLLMDDFLPECDKDFHAGSIRRLKNIYRQQISMRYNGREINSYWKEQADSALKSLILDIERQEKCVEDQKVSMISTFDVHFIPLTNHFSLSIFLHKHIDGRNQNGYRVGFECR